MASLKRKILFYTFCLIFFLMTPLIILYANGYKLNIKDPTSFSLVQKTGMMIIKTEPDQAKIYVDDKVEKPFFKNLLSEEENFIKTPAKIKGLLPGEYTIRLELQGYWPWSKKIKIESGQITNLSNIELFKKKSPLFITETDIQPIKISPDKKIAYLPEDDLLLELKNELIQKISTTSVNDAIHWSSDNKRVIIGDKIYRTKDLSLEIDLKKEIGNDIKNVKWFGNSSNKLIYRYKNSINSFDINSKKNEALIDKEECLDLMIKDGHLFYISANLNTVKMKMRNLTEDRTIKEIELPYSKGYKFKENDRGVIDIYDEKYNILYLIDPMSFISPLKEIVNNIKYSDWMDDNTLLYANDFEIWILDMEKDKRELITRISDPINGVIAVLEKKYILYSTDKSIKVIELGRKEEQFSTELISMDEISSPALCKDGEDLYFTARSGEKEGLYKLNIK